MAANNSRKKDPQEILKEMEAERKETEERFTIKAGEVEKLREQEVLSKSCKKNSLCPTKLLNCNFCRAY